MQLVRKLIVMKVERERERERERLLRKAKQSEGGRREEKGGREGERVCVCHRGKGGGGRSRFGITYSMFNLSTIRGNVLLTTHT